MSKIIDLTNKKFGMMTVINRAENRNGRPYWLCKCDCGNEKIVKGDNLKSGNVKSCGCLVIETNKTRKTHGLVKHRLYNIRKGMMGRCYNPNLSYYKNYGGRGITVCEEWRNDFQAFFDWAMSNGYSDNLTIDRIDVNGNYEPSNCRWITMKEQLGNKRTSRYIKYKGEEHTIAEWSRITGLRRDTIRARIERGWNEEKIFYPVHDDKQVVSVSCGKSYGFAGFLKITVQEIENTKE